MAKFKMPFGSDHELLVQDSDSSLVLADDIQLLVRNVRWSLIIAITTLGTLASRAAAVAVALVVRHD